MVVAPKVEIAAMRLLVALIILLCIGLAIADLQAAYRFSVAVTLCWIVSTLIAMLRSLIVSLRDKAE